MTLFYTFQSKSSLARINLTEILRSLDKCIAFPNYAAVKESFRPALMP